MPMPRRGFLLSVVALCATLDASAAEAPAEAIRAARAQSNAAIARHDVAAVVALLDAEYQITAGSGSLFHGREDEADAWRDEFAKAEDLLYVRTPQSVEVSDSGARAAEIGNWIGTWTTPAGPHRAHGRYAAHWRKVDGVWKIRSELFVTLGCEGTDCK